MPDAVVTSALPQRSVGLIETAGRRAEEPVRIDVLSDSRVWDEYVTAHPEGTFFHLSAWRDAVSDVFRHRPFYIAARRGDRIVGVLPLILVRSRIADRMLASVPYGVGGGILADDSDIATALFERSQDIAREQGCCVIDLRSRHATAPSDRDGVEEVTDYAGFERRLPATSDEVMRMLPRKARADARHARDRFKLEVSFDDGQLGDVWRLYAISMRRLGSLTYPYAFFERLIERTPGRHWVSLVRWNDRPVAGLVTFLFRDRAMPYFVGMTDDAHRCHAAHFIYLTAMERAVAHGLSLFDMGRSRRDNRGGYNFKRFLGFEPHALRYQRYTLPGRRAPRLSPSDARYRWLRCVWKHLPLSVTQRLGALVARHIPG